MLPERAVILAAGVGERLKWLTRQRPKALMSVSGRPVIEHIILRLASQGVRDIAVNVHHHADMLMDALGDGSRLGVRLYFSHEPQLLDSGGGVKKALTLLPGDGPVVVHNADVLADIDVRKLALLLPAGGAAVALVTNPAHHPNGDFSMRNGLVEERQEGASLTFAGVSVWDAEVFADYPSGRPFPLIQPMRDLMARQKLAGVVHRGRWFDIGRPRDLWRARRFGIRA